MMRFLSVVLCSLAMFVSGTLLADGKEKAKEEAPESLGRNVRLDFRLVPLENNDKGVFVVTSSPYFKTSVFFNGLEHEASADVAGEVRIVEDKLAIDYAMKVVFKHADGNADFSAASTVLLKPGQTLAVARMGEKVLEITASYVESKPATKGGE